MPHTWRSRDGRDGGKGTPHRPSYISTCGSLFVCTVHLYSSIIRTTFEARRMLWAVFAIMCSLCILVFSAIRTLSSRDDLA
ncbi:hypothetical protein C8Q72DRAFT_838803 [Fomitopsis betulina]|nr:hypothetical protein C8Q72DRAFT_838803 [Fomitopsis betulina]